MNLKKVLFINESMHEPNLFGQALSTASNSNGTGTGNTYKRIGITSNSSDGNFAMGGNAIDALENADALCNAEFSGFKALINNEGRYNGVGGDWILKANTEYRRMDGAIIGTTTAGSVFTFPLTNSMGVTNVLVWTGLTTTWGGSANTCDDWTSDMSNGANGDVLAVTSDAIGQVGSQCMSGLNLICVEQ